MMLCHSGIGPLTGCDYGNDMRNAICVARNVLTTTVHSLYCDLYYDLSYSIPSLPLNCIGRAVILTLKIIRLCEGIMFTFNTDDKALLSWTALYISVLIQRENMHSIQGWYMPECITGDLLFIKIFSLLF